MQKSALALAVAATMVASAVAHAETTFYGSWRMGIQYTDPDGPDSSNWDITDHSSRWGVRGSEDLGNGLSAIYQLESRIRADEFNGNGNGFIGRLAWVGLNTGFGAFKIGSQWTPYYNVAGRTDVFNSTWFNLYNGPFRQNNSFVYETPASLEFLKGEVMLVMDGPQGKDDIDIWQVGVNSTFGPVGFGAAYLNNEATDEDQWVVSAGVDFAGANFAAMYEDYDDGEHWEAVINYGFGNNIIRGAYGQNRPDQGDNVDEWAVGFQHNLSRRTRLWAEYSDLEDSQSLFNVGMRHDF